MDNTPPRRPPLVAPGSVRAAFEERPRTTFSDKPAYGKPPFKPSGGGYKSGGFKPRKTDADDPELIRDWPLVAEKGDTCRRVLSVRRDSIGWICTGKADGKTLIGLRSTGAAAIPVDAPYDEVNGWWRGAYPLTLKR
jgi:hypothetical protein